MKAIDNSVVWAKIGDAKFFSQIAKDVLVYGTACFALFYNLNTQKENLFVANSPSLNGDGIGEIRGHKSLYVFAYSENCKYPRVFIKTYPAFEDVFVLQDEAPEGYVSMAFSETTLLITLGRYPNFTITVWDWKTQQKYGEVDTHSESERHIMRCNWNKPVNMVDLWKDTKKLTYWDLQMCCKEFILSQHNVTVPRDLNVGLLSHAMWTTEGGLYVTDSRGSIFTVDNEFMLEMVYEANYQGICPTSIIWYKGGLVISGPDKAIRHYVKKTGIWTCDWIVELEVYIHKIGNVNGQLLGVEEIGELIKIYDDGSIQQMKGPSRRYYDFCLIAPLGECIVGLRRNIYLDVFKVETGEQISEFKLENIATAINANPVYPYLALSCKSGFVDLISVYKPEKLTLLASLHLSENCIQQIKFFEKGRIIVTGNLDSGEIFIIEGLPGSQMRVVSHIEVKRQILDYILVASKTCYRLYALPVTSKYRAGNMIIRYCITESGIINVKKYFMENRDSLYTHLVPSAKPNRDRVFYGLPFYSRKIHELETKRGDSSIRVSSKIKTGHLLRNFLFKLTSEFSYTWGYDGCVFVRDANFDQEIAAVRVHHRYDLGVKKAYVTPFGAYVITLGYDRVLCCTKIKARNIDEYMKENLTSLMASDKYALMFKRPTVGLRIDGKYANKNWLEIDEMERFEKEQMLCKEERSDILKECEGIRAELTALVTHNMEGPPSEKIDLLEFYLDTIHFNQTKMENRVQCKNLQAYLKALIDAQTLVSKYIIKTYYEPMDVQGKIVRGIFQKTIASIYILLPPNEDELKKLARVEEQRKIEEFLSINCTFQPWLPMPKNELRALLAFKPKFTNLDYNTLLSKVMLEETNTQLSPESQAALIGAVTQLYIDRNPWHYKQRQLVSFYQCDIQQTITNQEVVKLKQHYNQAFNTVADLKLREMDNIKEKHARLRYIIKEFNYFSDAKIDFDIEDPLWTQEENADLIMTVTDNEITAVPYVSPSEMALWEAKYNEEERLRLALLADDFRDRALYMMMSGVLEVKWEDELKKEIPLPKCMVEKRPNEYTEEDKRTIKEYEDKVVFLCNERERYKNMLEVEFNKISLSLRDSIRKFNQKLKDTVEYKMYVDSAMNQENLRVMRARLTQFERIKLYQKEDRIKLHMDKNETIIQDLQDAIKHLNEVLNECRVNVEGMQVKEKVLEKAFRKELQELSTPVQEQALKIYRRRPKWNFRQVTTHYVLIELAKCVITQEKSAILPQEYIDFLKNLNHLDEYIGIPPSIDEATFRTICKHRRVRIEFEIKLKAAQMQLYDGEAVVANYQKRHMVKKEKNVKLAAKIRKCKENYLYHMHNIPVQIVLRKGLVEVPLTGEMIDDFMDAVLVPKKEIVQINELIKKAGNNKLKTIQQNMAFRRRIIVTEWDHKRLRMTINDLIEQMNDINATKLLRDMQVYLKGRAMGRKDTETLEQEIEVMTVSFETNMRSRREKLKKLQKQLASYQENNKALDKTIHELNIDVCALKLNFDPDLDGIETEALKHRFKCIIKRGDLVQKIQKHQSQILMLQTELELLRLRTYPTFKYKLMDVEDKEK